jgi:hypothetical protein
MISLFLSALKRLMNGPYILGYTATAILFQTMINFVLFHFLIFIPQGAYYSVIPCFVISVSTPSLWCVSYFSYKNVTFGLKYLNLVVKCPFAFWMYNVKFILFWSLGLALGFVKSFSIICRYKNWIFACTGCLVTLLSKKRYIQFLSFLWFGCATLSCKLTYFWIFFPINSAGITEGFSMCAGDFVEVYSEESQECKMTHWANSL